MEDVKDKPRSDYRGFYITHDPPPIPLRTTDFQFAHHDYDGPEDRRCGHGRSIEDCKAQIDEMLDEMSPPDRGVSQIELIACIAKFLEVKGGITLLLPRQLNAVIRAADQIIDELDKPEVTVTPGMGLRAWLNSDHTGLSSLFMAAKLGPSPRSATYAFPLDPSDLWRCIGLLDAVPELRPRISEMAETGKEWAAIAAAWDELEALVREEFPSGQAPRCYARMQELLEKAGQ